MQSSGYVAMTSKHQGQMMRLTMTVIPICPHRHYGCHHIDKNNSVAASSSWRSGLSWMALVWWMLVWAVGAICFKLAEISFDFVF